MEYLSHLFGRYCHLWLKLLWCTGQITVAQFQLKLSKYCLMRERVPFLGHYATHDVVEVDSIKTAAVQDWPTSRTVKDV